MKGFIIALFVVVTLAAGAGALYWLQKPAFTDVPKFSAYAPISDETQEKAKRTLSLISSFDPEVEVASTTYPLELLDQEIEYLIGLAPQRDTNQQESFLKLYDDTSNISTTGGVLQTILDDAGRIHTKELVTLLWSDIETIVAREQIRLDVARPLQIDLRVNSQVKTPDTPSYPDEMTAKLFILQVLLTKLGYEDTTLEEAINIAIERTHIYGINTRLDTEYAARLATAYFDKVMLAHPTFEEYLSVTKDREWSQKSITKPPDGYVPDVSIVSKKAEVVSGGIVFSAVIKNDGIASTPAEYPILIEVDVYG